MAEAIVTVLLDQLASITRLEFEQEVNLILSIQREVDSLTRTLNFIKMLLEDAERKQVTSETVKRWLERLKEAMFNAEDVLDEWFTRISISQSHNGSSLVPWKVRSYLSSLCSCFLPVRMRHEIAYKIKDIRENLDGIARDNQLRLIENNNQQECYYPPVTSSIVDVLEILGRDTDKDVLVSRLVGESSTQQEPHVPIISIIGMGGLGKTTLAQLVYSEVKSKFEMSMWVCVSQPFDLQKVTKEIIEQAGGNTQNVVSWETIHQALSASVKGKRFLLVLDDVWSEDDKVWTPLKISLNTGARGSRIIVTTRNGHVANMIKSSYTHRLGQLSNDDTMSLFWRIAFSGRSLEELQKFEEVGNEIAKKCKGLPLVVRSLASLLRLERTPDDWRSVLASDVWEVDQVENNCLPALLLSYYALPSHLKQCFTFCAFFPKDTKMPKDKLVKLWMAQGFLGSDDGSKNLEMVGAKCFEDLAERSFFQDFEKDDGGYITECKMHDLVHDLARFLNGNGFRHLYVREDMPECMLENLRSISLLTDSSGEFHLQLYRKLRYLRVLEIDLGLVCYELPNEIGKLLHLRYIDLSYNYELKELPESMCELYNLQTLKLEYCSKLCGFPIGIGKLLNLRHIEVNGTNELTCFPQSIRRLIRLRTLCKFPVSGASIGCGIEALENLNYLEKELVITGLRHLKSVYYATRAELQKKMNLRSLKFDFGYVLDEDVSEEEIKQMEGILEALQPNKNLQALEITCFPGFTFPFWMSGKALLSNLVALELRNCKKCFQLPSLGSLGSLESLMIVGLESVKCIRAEFYGVGVVEVSFPKLKTLSFTDMKEWEDWEIPSSSFKVVMPRLCELKIESCWKLVVLPALGRLESLESLQINSSKLPKHIGAEFYGVGFEENSFLKLKTLSLASMKEWEDWKIPFPSFKQAMPLLRVLKLESCTKLVGLPALGRLESLESLEIKKLESVKHIGAEFYGVGVEVEGVSFPKLKKLKFSLMEDWEGWEIPFLSYKKVMPLLCQLEVESCQNLVGLPALGRLESLESISMENLPSVTKLGIEFLEISSGGEEILFPKLTTLIFKKMEQWQEWNFPLLSHLEVKNIKIMPHLHALRILNCPKLKTLPESLCKLPSLKILHLSNVKVARVASVAAGIGESSPMELFPKLRVLMLINLPEWEETVVTSATTSIMPNLELLIVNMCEKLKVVPNHLFSPSLKFLTLAYSPLLMETPSGLPPLLESLVLYGDVGAYSRSLLSASITHNGNRYSHLKSVSISHSPHSSLPQGLENFTSLQQLIVQDCDSLDLKLEELRHFPMLQTLIIFKSSRVEERCIREEWSTLSNIPYKIIINDAYYMNQLIGVEGM